ncbi:receptor-like protein 7 [Helianthus annuus]|nr:receptor-like protein 7 [Helianthus annuus]
MLMSALSYSNSKRACLLTFHGYSKVASWNLNRSDGVRNCCLWDGVECEFGHVIGLNLSNSFLYGPISSNNTLFTLIHLRTLNLADNDFRSSQIPSGIGQLSQLENLNLSNSWFSGEVPKQISQPQKFRVNIDSELPASIGNLTHLNILDLRSCGFIGTLPTSVRNLTRLTVLSLEGNHNLTGYIPEFHGSSELKQLIVAGTNFQGSIPDSIGNLRNLNILDLRSCGFTGTLPASLSNLAQLTVLNLMGNKFTGILPSSIGNLTQLRELLLMENGMSGQIPSSFSNLTQLTRLMLSRNKFTGSLPSLESFSNLTYLSLSYNNFDRWKLPDWFGKLNKITDLILYDVNLYGEIPSSFFNQTQIERLYLSRNQLKGELPSSLLNLQNLEDCDLDGNNVTMDFDLFLSLKKLEYLNLNGNNITLSVTHNNTNETQPKFKSLTLASCNLKVFPEFLRSQKQLNILYLDNNNIEGLIPGWMWNISKETLRELSLTGNLLMGFEQHSPVAPWVSLQTIDLSNNMLHGSIPLPPPTTENFLISDNMLSGEIPSSICNLSSLQLLDLSFNNITGSIPPCLEQLSSSLVAMNLRSNSLRGTIPNIFTNECKLKIIDLSYNKLEGRVPRSLEYCDSLQILDIGHNFIEDMFPFWLGALSELQVLILRFNKFHGIIRIPSESKVNFPKLRVIDLSYNSFSGDLPHKYFQEWFAMKETKVNATYIEVDNTVQGYLSDISWFSIQMTNKGVELEYGELINIFFAVDLSSNTFSGKIPESIKTLGGLKLLNLSNNELSGIIPPSMGNLTNLESLDLLSNKLSGMIPQDLVQLNFLVVFNVSNNHLTGTIPQGRQFNTFSNNSYMTNQALCGFPLSMKCGDSEESKPPKVSLEEDTESNFPSGIDWVVILIGVATGLVIGTFCGDYLTTKCYKWFSQRFRMRRM